MNNKHQNINWTKKSGILITSIYLIGILLNRLVQPYRGTWIYQYGSQLSLYVCYGAIFWSLIYTIFLFLKRKWDLKNNIIWILVSAVPFLYILMMMLISMSKTIE